MVTITAQLMARLFDMINPFAPVVVGTKTYDVSVLLKSPC
jgi:hypothetical protein